MLFTERLVTEHKFLEIYTNFHSTLREYFNFLLNMSFIQYLKRRSAYFLGPHFSPISFFTFLKFSPIETTLPVLTFILHLVFSESYLLNGLVHRINEYRIVLSLHIRGQKQSILQLQFAYQNPDVCSDHPHFCL